MKIIIGGAGAVGYQITKMLSGENHEVVVVDIDEESLNVLSSQYDVLTVTGSITSFNVLKQSGVKNADLFVAVASNMEVNMMACILAKRLGAQRTVARIDSAEYLNPTNRSHCIGMGVDALVYPQMLAAREIVNLLTQTGTSEVFNFSQGMLSLHVIKLNKNASVINRTVVESTQVEEKLLYRVVAITRDGETIIPRASDIFKEGDVVYVIANQKGISKITKYSGHEKLEPENIMILGGGRIGFRTSSVLEKTANVKLIDYDKSRCFELTDMLSDSLVIYGDGRDTETLVQEGIENMDAFIAVTGDSEINILTCLQAKKMGVRKTIAAVESIDYISLTENMGIDAIINKKLIAASYILRFTINADVSSFMSLTATDAEVFEFIVRPGAKITKGKLKDINFPKDAVVGGFIRKKTAFTADGNTHIKANDHVVVFSLSTAVNKLEEFFN
ncbi:MAG: Trk system potassium transporter TrkA [Salinivirgaceae bacterium]|jgi:trk system potassium uptake protein TrkA|nr:Trk system potassium transporter TrkA [Bacteroidales bacterium]